MALKRFVFAAFVAFLASAATIGLLGRLSPLPERPPGARTITAEELARHAVPGDCWIAVHGGVYDVGACVDAHPAPRRVLADWCGRDATRAFADKGAGRPHSAEARAALEALRVGALR